MSIYLNLRTSFIAVVLCSTARAMLIRLSLATILTGSSISVFLVVVLVLGGLAGLLVSFASNYTFMVLILFFVGVSFGAFRILTSTLVANNSVPENRGLANSLLNFSQSTGNLVNIFTSSLVETYGLIPVFLLGGFTCLSAIIPTLRAKLGR
jgi:MFS family permease